MFSFFTKHNKKSPVVSPSSSQHKIDDTKKLDDFEIINRNKNPDSPAYPALSVPANHPFNRQFSVTINYTQNIPFKLNPALVSGSNDDMWNYKLREMNSFLQRINRTDYDFRLERSIVES